MMRSEGAVGIYDSGVGGLTVVREVARQLPCESVVYFGDTARVPYGGRSPAEIIRFGREIQGFLLDQGVKLILIACNTSSALAYSALAADSHLPLLGVLDAGAQAAIAATVNGRLGVLATEATAKSGAYERAIKRRLPGAFVLVRGCPALVPLIEDGRVEGEELRRALREYLQPMLSAGVDTIVYGCTHYPFLDPLVAEMAGPEIARVDPAASLVAAGAALLRRQKALAAARVMPDRYVVSGDPERFRALGSIFLGRTLPPVERINIDGYRGAGS